MESLRLIPLHHGFYDGVGGGLQQALVPIGIQRVGELLETAMVRWTGAGSAANGGCHRLDPLQGTDRRSERGGQVSGERTDNRKKTATQQIASPPTSMSGPSDRMILMTTTMGMQIMEHKARVQPIPTAQSGYS